MRDVRTHRDEPAVVHERTSAAGSIFRVLLTIAGVGALAVGAFLDWFDGLPGDRIDVDAFWRTGAGEAASFVTSAGIVMLGVAFLGLLGLAAKSGWLVRVAGVLGLIGTFLLWVQMGRADRAIVDATQLGLWLCAAGAVTLLLAGFVPTTKTVVERSKMDRRERVDRTAAPIVDRDDDLGDRDRVVRDRDGRVIVVDEDRDATDRHVRH